MLAPCDALCLHVQNAPCELRGSVKQITSRGLSRMSHVLYQYLWYLGLDGFTRLSFRVSVGP